MTDDSEYFRNATRHLSAYLVMKGKDPVLNILFEHPRGGDATVAAFVYGFGGFVRGVDPLGSYLEALRNACASRAFSNAISQIHEPSIVKDALLRFRHVLLDPSERHRCHWGLNDHGFNFRVII